MKLLLTAAVVLVLALPADAQLAPPNEAGKKLEARGVKFDIPYRDVPSIGLKIAYVTDPSGVYIELTEGYAQY